MTTARGFWTLRRRGALRAQRSPASYEKKLAMTREHFEPDMRRGARFGTELAAVLRARTWRGSLTSNENMVAIAWEKARARAARRTSSSALGTLGGAPRKRPSTRRSGSTRDDKGPSRCDANDRGAGREALYVSTRRRRIDESTSCGTALSRIAKGTPGFRSLYDPTLASRGAHRSARLEARIGTGRLARSRRRRLSRSARRRLPDRRGTWRRRRASHARASRCAARTAEEHDGRAP